MDHALLPEPYQRVGVALLIGILIGLDRERAEMRKHRHLFAGVRTFPLISLLGAVSMMLLEQTGPILVAAGFLGVAAIALAAYLRTARAHVGATTEVASLATYLLGVLAGSGQLLLAGSIGIVVAVLLAAKPRLEGFSRALSQAEIAAALELAVISCIVLPLLPNHGYGPWGVWNPFSIWLVVVLVSALSFAGFVAVRFLGEDRGLALAGIVGGLVSSTAVTVAMTKRAREDPAAARAAAGAVVLASVVMGLRVAAFCAAFGPGILPRLAPTICAMTLLGALAAWITMRRGASKRGAAGVSNPSNLLTALTFAAIYALILLAVRGAKEFFGDAGMLAAAALASLADVDAITIAFASGGPGDDVWRTAAAGVSIALVGNTLFKLGMAVAGGSSDFRRIVAMSQGAMALVGAAVAVVMYLYL